jgi:hypothetical protein
VFVIGSVAALGQLRLRNTVELAKVRLQSATLDHVL